MFSVSHLRQVLNKLEELHVDEFFLDIPDKGHMFMGPLGMCPVTVRIETVKGSFTLPNTHVDQNSKPKFIKSEDL
jgi:hypothetical protein